MKAGVSMLLSALERIRKMFWKVVNKVGKVRHKLGCCMKDDHSDVKFSEEEVRQI